MGQLRSLDNIVCSSFAGNYLSSSSFEINNKGSFGTNKKGWVVVCNNVLSASTVYSDGSDQSLLRLDHSLR